MHLMVIWQVNDIRRPRLYDEMIQTKEMAREDINVSIGHARRRSKRTQCARAHLRLQHARMHVKHARADYTYENTCYRRR